MIGLYELTEIMARLSRLEARQSAIIELCEDFAYEFNKIDDGRDREFIFAAAIERIKEATQ